MRKFAISDIHGCSRTLEALLDKLAVTTADEVYFLGDYIDRGPDSAGVIERLIELRERYECTFLLGNHESMFLDFLGWTDKAYFGGDAFLMNGGDRKAAEILGIPDGITQAGLFPIAYTIGTDFKPAKRLPLEPITHWDQW